MSRHSFTRAALLLSALLGIAAATAGAATEATGQVTLEAEAFTTNTPRTISSTAYSWVPLSDIGGYSGAGFMEAIPNDGMTVATAPLNVSPELQYAINFTSPGTYYVWLRGYADTTETVSVYVGLDGAGPAAQIDLSKTGVWSWSATSAGSGAPVVVTVGTAGPHTLNIWMRDAGFVLDKIVLSRNANFSPEYSADFWRNQSIYQIMTDRFFDGDPANNVAGLPNYNPSVGNQAHGGDFKGIEKKLDYIKALGATAIWISPVLMNGNGDYHGYAATDFYRVNPRMGTLSDLQSLVSEAHKRGLLVVNDVVVNHGSTWVDSGDAGWAAFRSPPNGYNLRYNSGGQKYAAPFDDASLTAAFGSTVLTNLFHNNGATANWSDATQVELGELSSLDDFRTESDYVRQKMKEIWSYWINTAGFDGFRIDTVKHVEMGFWGEWSPAIRSAAAAAGQPNFFQFGEVFDGSDSKVGSYTGTKSGGNYKMESVLDYPLYYTMGSVFATASGNTGQIENRYNNLTTTNYDASALNALVLNLDNHDNSRFLNASGSTTARLELALTFLYTTRGIPSLYYGTEQDFNGGADPANREDMFDGSYEQGPSLGDNFSMTSPRFQLVAKLNNLRRLYPALRTGTHQILWVNWNAPGLLAYARRLAGEEVCVIINTATTPQTMSPRPTIHPAGTVLVNLLNRAETVTVVAGTDGIPAITMPATSAKMFVAQSQVRALSPVVTAVTPAHDATGVSPASTISVTFSQAMNPSTVQAAFSTTPASTGIFAWSGGNTVMTYTPSSNLAGTTLHALRIESTATDAASLAMYAPFESRFTTGASSNVARPSINSVSSSAVTDATATLGATVTPNGAVTTVTFEYGTSTSYGLTTPGQLIGSGNSPASSNAPLTGLPSGTTIHYRVVATNSQGTTTGADNTFTTTAPQPQVTTTAASYVTAVSANLNGTVNPSSLPTSVYFAYGDRADALPRTTTAQNAGNGSANLDQFAFVSGLTPDTTVFYRLVAVSGTQTVYGAVLSFRTLAIKPAIISTTSTNMNSTGATLNAAISANGFETGAWFEYGTNDAYGTTTTIQTLPPTATNTAISEVLTSLTAGQTYHFRGVASNTNGFTFGADQSFTTGFPPPTVFTGAASPVTTNSATISGTVSPNSRPSGYWVEYGSGTNLTSSTRQVAADNAETYTSFSYTAPNNTGGSGLGAYVGYVTNSSPSNGTRVLVTTNSGSGTANRLLSGEKSFGLTSGTSRTRGTQSGYRTISQPRPFGTFSFALRCDVDNTKGFTGLNLKAQSGTSFGAGELISVGMTPLSGGVGGNNGLLVTDAGGPRMIDFGVESRGAIFDASLDFDTLTGSYTLRITRRADAASVATTREVQGLLRLYGPTTSATAFGFLNSNNSGASNQNLIFDNISFVGGAAAGDGTSDVAVSQALAGLSPNTLYAYRVAVFSPAGLSYGATKSFVTGTDLTIQKNGIGPFTPGGSTTFTLAVSNAGSIASTGLVTVTEQPPAGLLITSMSGAGWAFNPGNLTCTTTNLLAAGGSYPPITVQSTLATNATGRLTNTASLSGGGDAISTNNTATQVFAVSPPFDGIEAWRQTHFGSPANSGPAADAAAPAGDGMANLLKYAMGLVPTNVAARVELPALTNHGTTLSIIFRRARDPQDITMVVEAADGVVGSWTNIWTSTTNAFAGGTNAFSLETVPDPVPINSAPNGQRYLRLKVTRP
ncbi:MAG: alpha-amylase family glycosyl hydrolase [Chthoniobacterales bacterium]